MSFLLNIAMKFKGVRQAIFKVKTLIIVLVILLIISCGFMVYFGIRASKAEKLTSFSCLEKLEKVHNYAVLLDQSNKLARQEKSLDGLEQDVRSLGNGTLLAEWQNVVFGGNKKQDLDNYFDVIIDSLMFFSK
jgi:hypothetical protein